MGIRLSLLILSYFAAIPTLATAQAPMPVVLRGSDDPALGDLEERVRGQVSDLAVEVRLVGEPALEATLSERLGAAATFEADGAAAVIWVEAAGDGGLLVQLAQDGRLLARIVSADSVSARVEGAALLIRSLLQAVLAGAEIGMEPPETPVPPGPDSTERPQVTPDPPETLTQPRPHSLTHPRATPADPSTVRGLRLGVGWQLAGDGVAGAHGVRLAFGLRQRLLDAGLIGSIGFPAGTEDAFTHVTLSRHTVGAYGGAAIPLGSTFTLLPRGILGALFLERSTTALSDGVSATPSNLSVSFLLAAELSLAMTVRLFGQPIQLVATGGADLVLPPTDLTYVWAGETYLRDALWTLQPRLGLGIAVELY